MTLSHSGRSNGFTLVELIVVIVISGIIASVITNIIIHPIEGYDDLQRRTELVDSAEMTLQKIARDIRRALPNSVRTSASAIDMINTLDAGMYRAFPPPGGPANLIAFGWDDGSFAGDDTFTIYGQLKQLTLPFSDTIELVINNSNSTDVYAQSVNTDRTSSTENYVITPPGLTISVDASADSVITLSSPVFLTPFISATPQLSTSIQGRRFYLVNGAIAYKCESGQLNRYSDYALSTTIGNTGAASPNLLASHVDCSNTSFIFDPGSAQRGALATLKITLSDSGETVTLLHQIHVSNTP